MFWTGLIAAFTLVVHMVTYNTLGFHRDELLYLALGKHLARRILVKSALNRLYQLCYATSAWQHPLYIEIISCIGRCLAYHHYRIDDKRARW